MPKIVKKYGKITLVLGLILVLVAVYLLIPTGQAATIVNRETKISDSRPSQTSVIYDFKGDHSATVVKCLRMQICTTATGTCTVPTGLTTTGGARNDANWSGWTVANWTGDFTTNGDIKYTYATGEAGGTNYSFATSGITNPSSAGTYYAWINTYSDTTCATGVDSGVTAFAIVSGVTVSATIAEYLTFTITDSAIGMGTWTAGSTAVRFANADETGDTVEQAAGAPTQLQVSSNAGGGLTITLHDVGNGSGSAGLYKSTATTKLIAATAANSVAAGSESYAVYGKSASGLTIATGFSGGTSTGVMTTSPQTFASATGAVSSAYVDAQPKAAIAGTTPAGSYSDTLVFIATPTY